MLRHFLFLLLLVPALVKSQTKLQVTVADSDSIHEVGDPRISPDGKLGGVYSECH
jgi:hypothetical protein